MDISLMSSVCCHFEFYIKGSDWHQSNYVVSLCNHQIVKIFTSVNLSATMYRTLQDLSLAASLSVGITSCSVSSEGRMAAIAAHASTARRRTES